MATTKPPRARAKPRATAPARRAPSKAPAASAKKIATKAPAKVDKKPAPPAKVKLVRDSFTLPENDHALIKSCKKAAITAGRETKKSEVVRAAIRSFSALAIDKQLEAYAALQGIAIGRPKKG
jgi:hypothetical protein